MGTKPLQKLLTQAGIACVVGVSPGRVARTFVKNHVQGDAELLRGGLCSPQPLYNANRLPQLAELLKNPTNEH